VAPRDLTLHCNAGLITVTRIGDLIGYWAVWLYEDVIANLLALNNV